jgi:hypothetical protein
MCAFQSRHTWLFWSSCKAVNNLGVTAEPFCDLQHIYNPTNARLYKINATLSTRRQQKSCFPERTLEETRNLSENDLRVSVMNSGNGIGKS